LLADYEARIAALERLAGKLALENDFLKGALQRDRRPKSATTSVVVGPLVSPSQKDAD
jgi:transposase